MATALAASALGCASGVAYRAGDDCVPGARLGAPAAEALSAGRAHLEAGRAETAACFFEAAARAQPLLADHAARWQAEALLQLGRPQDALRRAQAGAGRASKHAGRALARVMARAHSELGAHTAAREAWRRAGQGESDALARAELLQLRAQSHEAQGERAAASTLWLELWRDYGETRAGAVADAALARLHGDAADAPQRSADALGARCRALARARSNEAALESCDAALALLRASPERAQLARQRADLLFRLRRYPEAARAYKALAPSQAASFWRARSLARSGDAERAMALFEHVARGSGERAMRAHFLLGTLLEERAAALAAARYERVARETRDAEQRRTALWRLGWNAYRAQNFARAAEYFERLARDDADAPDALRGRYWAARTHAQMPEGEARAARAFAALAAEVPFSYHGFRASTRAPREALAAARAAVARERRARAPKKRARVTLPPRTLERARVLTSAGFGEDAAAELAALRAKVRGDANRKALAALLHAAGDHYGAGRLILDAYQRELRRGPTRADAEAGAQLWRLAWPRAFAPEVEAAVARSAVPPELLYAVMREESHYRPRVVSVVGARGLAQIMPETGRVLARAEPGARARDFDPEELFEPARNLALAARYLETLLQKFDGRAALAAAAYNAGPEAVQRWRASHPQLDEDAWVEAIPYAQTRGYVKRVLRSAHVYRLLYRAPARESRARAEGR